VLCVPNFKNRVLDDLKSLITDSMLFLSSIPIPIPFVGGKKRVGLIVMETSLKIVALLSLHIAVGF
jgi:hypothetical protein